MDRKADIFDLLLVLADGNIANLYNVAHQCSTLHPRGQSLTVSVLRREKEGVLFPAESGSGWCFVIRITYEKIVLDIRLLPSMGLAEAIMVDFPGLNAGPLLPYSSVSDRNDRMAAMANSILRTNLTLFIRRGHRFTDQPRFYPQLENPITKTRKPGLRLARVLKILWPKTFGPQKGL